MKQLSLRSRSLLVWLLLVLILFARQQVFLVSALAPLTKNAMSISAGDNPKWTAVSSLSSSSDKKRLLPLIQTAFPTAHSYQIDAEIVQSNAVGYKLSLLLSDDDADDKDEAQQPTKIFLKHVQASSYTNREWIDLRRTLLYARTEARFYRDFQPLLRNRGFDAIPHAFCAQYSLDGWIAEAERATQKADAAVLVRHLPGDPETKGGFLILECISEATHFQDSPLEVQHCHQCLEAVAALHAAAWQDVELLQKAQVELSKASFHLEMRNPKELEGIEIAWDGFVQAFEQPFANECGLEWTPQLRNLGARLKRVAHHVSQQVSPAPNDPFSTLIHGDYKSLNVFLPRTNDNHAVLVDFASTGIGLGMSDLAMHIHHAVHPEYLANGGEESLVRHYWEHLTKRLDDDGSSLGTAYTWEQAWRHYQYAIVDYLRFFTARMWKGATPATMAKKKDNKNVSLINRDVPSACAFLRVAEAFLSEIEKEVNRDK